MAGVHRTDIEWTDYAIGGPVRFKRKDTGAVINFCVKHSDGCKNCYSEAMGTRWGTGLAYSAASLKLVDAFLDEDALRHMLTFRPKGPYRHGVRPKVFVGDMTDLFGAWVKDEWLDKLFAVFALRPDVDFQVLTKRPERMAAYLAGLTEDAEDDAIADISGTNAGYRLGSAAGTLLDGAWIWNEGKRYRDKIEEFISDTHADSGDDGDPDNGRNCFYVPKPVAWPLPNLWLGSSMENQKAVDERMLWLKKCPAVVRFISYEPALGPIHADFTGTHWVIGGGESGGGARENNVAWFLSVREQCKAAGVAYFHKQLGEKSVKANLAIPAGCEGEAFNGVPRTIRLKVTGKGGTMEEWPEALRVREFPNELVASTIAGKREG